MAEKVKLLLVILVPFVLIFGCTGYPDYLKYDVFTEARKGINKDFQKTFDKSLIYTGLYIDLKGSYNQERDLFHPEISNVHLLEDIIKTSLGESSLFARTSIQDEDAEIKIGPENDAPLFIKFFTNRARLDSKVFKGFEISINLAILIYRGSESNAEPLYYRVYNIERFYKPKPAMYPMAANFYKLGVELVNRALADIGKSDLDNPDYRSIEEKVIRLDKL